MDPNPAPTTISLLAHSHHRTPTRSNGGLQDVIKRCLAFFCPLDRYDDLLSTTPTPAAALDPLVQCGPAIVALLRRQCEIIRDQIGSRVLAIKRCDDLMAIAHDHFYATHFESVNPCWPELYREASLLKFTALISAPLWKDIGQLRQAEPPQDPLFSETDMDELVSTIDMALIMAGPPRDQATREYVAIVLETLTGVEMARVESQRLDGENPSPNRRRLNDSKNLRYSSPVPSKYRLDTTTPEPRIRRSYRVDRVVRLPHRVFYEHMHRPTDPNIGPSPLIIAGELDGWPASSDSAWHDPEYLMAKTIGGRRLIPIETGASYVDAGFGQKIVKFRDFMREYILRPNENTQDSPAEPGYLAQYDLFAQIPSLRNDIVIPDYCFTDAPGPHPSSPHAAAHAALPRLEEPLLNAWFGPKGTTTPLHTDPYHNILAQVVGRKYVRLYPPAQSANLYARGTEDGIDMSNTSSLDIGVLAGLDGTNEERTDAAKRFPLARDAAYVECILEEGECLYIPIGWWHYVRSLSVSFSVSFWFN